MARKTGSRGFVVGALSVGVLVSFVAGGCGKGDRWWKDNNGPVTGGDEATEVDTSLTALSGNSDPVTALDGGEGFGSTQDQVVESARMMDEYFSGMAAGEDLEESVVVDDGGGEAVVGELVENGGVEDIAEVADAETGTENGAQETVDDGLFSLAAAAAESGLVDDGGDGGVDDEAVDDEEIVVVAVDAEQRKAELVAELVDVLTGLARTSENPGEAAVALAGMDSMSVAVLDGLRDEGVLSESELSTLRAAREVLDSISSSGSIASPDAVAEVLSRVKDDLDRASGIRVARALLCTRVDGFGKYEPFGSNEFVAGQTHEVIVYVEVDRFGHRELTGTDGQERFEVEMSQRLELYHVADDLNTWNRAAEVDRSVSRNRVRDYYLINKITLPPNLGVGRYHLKVVMRDLVEGKVGEMIIPIRMVVR